VHPRVGDIEVDFVPVSKAGARLSIEVDGRRHRDTPEQDKARDAYLHGQGYDVMRLSAREVLETPFEVIHRVEEWFQDHDAFEEESEA
jgi:very-short-patch-repair endonuclease